MDKTGFIFKTFLINLKYRVDKKMLQRFLSDPDNLVLSYTNTLDYFKIKYVAARVPKMALNQLPKHFITQVSNGKTEHIVLASKDNNDNLKIQLSEQKIITLTKNQFLEDWTGFIIAVEENEDVSKKTLTKKNIVSGCLIICALSLIMYVGFTTSSLSYLTFFILSLLGLGMSYLIVKEKIGQKTIATKYCKISTTTSCKNVLNSKSAKILKDIDLSDMVSIYFIFLSIIFVIQPMSYLFIVISVLSLFVVAYSIHQQYFKIKQWCPLCLGVALILSLQFITVLTFYEAAPFKYIDILVFTSLLGFVTLGWLSVMPLLSLKQINNMLEIESLSFRRNYKLFIPYYNTLNQIDTEDTVIPQITLGVKKPLLKLTIITNPVCNSCIDAHKTYMDILEKHHDSIQLNYRFLVSNKDRTDSETIVSERLLQLYFENDKDVFFEAFNDWYDKISPKKWIGKWGKCEDLKYNKILIQQMSWCLKESVESTPTILINNRLFPKNYGNKDIEHFIEPILEQKINKIEKGINNIHA